MTSIRAELESARKNTFILFGMCELQKRDFLGYFGEEKNPIYIVEQKEKRLIAPEITLEMEIRKYLTNPVLTKSICKVDQSGFGHDYVICLRKLKYFHSKKEMKRLLNSRKQTASSTSLKYLSKKLKTQLLFKEIPSISLGIYEVGSYLRDSLACGNDQKKRY